MDLFLLRHGIASQRGTVRPLADSNRPLTPKGIRRMRQVAKGLKAMGLSFDRILSSPFLRARQTAEIVAGTFSDQNVEYSRHLQPDGDAQALLAELNARHAPPKTVLLVGHEPYLSRLISQLASGTDALSVNLKKGGLCKLSLGSPRKERSAVLEWLLTPGQMRRMGKSR